MEKKTLKDIFKEHGLDVKQAGLRGINCNTLQKHLSGERRLKAETALRYERLLGIPRWELRPDLWEPPKKTKQGEP